MLVRLPLHLREELKYAMTTAMAPSAMTSGMNKLPELCVQHTIVNEIYFSLQILNNIVLIISFISVAIGAPVSGRDSVYGSGSGRITLDNVVCNGGEANLFKCTHNEIFSNNCNHTEDAAVVCGSKSPGLSYKNAMFIFHSCSISVVACVEGAVRIVNDGVTLTSLQPEQDFIKDEVARGRVEVCVNGTFGSLCDMALDNMDASVVCRQLGFSSSGMSPVTSLHIHLVAVWSHQLFFK